MEGGKRGLGGCTSFDAGETEFCAHEEFFSSAELFDFPDYGGFFGDVVDASYCCSEAGCICVFGDWNDDFDVVGC